MIDWYEVGGRQLDSDPDADPVVGPSDSRLLSARHRVEACEQRLTLRVAEARQGITDLLPEDRYAATRRHLGELIAEVERAANALAVENGRYGWLRSAELHGGNPTAALVAWQTARDREAGR